jgi:hypothetical protein
MKKMLQTLNWFPGNQTTKNSDTVAKLPDDPLDTYPTRTRTLQSMKWVVMMMLLIPFLQVNAQFNYIVEVSELEKDWGRCNADGGTDDPIFEFDCYERSSTTDIVNYNPNIWIGRTFEGVWNPRTNDMNCNGYVMANGHNRPSSSDNLNFWLKGSDEEYCCAWYCDHNANSCVSGWTSTSYTYRNYSKNQWNQVQLNWSGSYRGKVSVKWGNYYANPQSDYGNGEWVGAFYDNTNSYNLYAVIWLKMKHLTPIFQTWMKMMEPKIIVCLALIMHCQHSVNYCLYRVV